MAFNIKQSNFKFEIGDTFNDYNRDIIILERFYKEYIGKKPDKYGKIYAQRCKYYKYKCNKCGWTNGQINEHHLQKGVGCGCCTGRVVVEGINDIPTTAPWMVKYFQGGYKEAKQYTKGSNKSIYPICPDCGKVKNKLFPINNLYKFKTIYCDCGDGISYPEKIMCSILRQLGLKYQKELSITTFKWCGKYRYDFYFEYKDGSYIIETHGEQHYIKTNYSKDLEKTQANDHIKKQLARSNGIDNYIVVDCRKSNIDYIKNSILNSELSVIFDLSKIDWLECEKFATSNLIKEVCNYWNNKEEQETTKDLVAYFELDKCTILKYLKKGNKLGYCEYDAELEKLKNYKLLTSTTKNKHGKKVEIIKDNVSFGIFDSCAELSRQSEELFGIKLNVNGIYRVAKKKQKRYKGYEFKCV